MDKSYRSPSIQTRFKGRFLFLFISLLCFFVVSPLLRGFIGIQVLLDIFLSAILITALYTFSRKKHLLLIGTLLALPMLAATWSTYFVKIPFMYLASQCFGIVFIAFMVGTILSYVFKQYDITLDVINGAVVVYLLTAVMWAFIFRVIEVLQPGSFTITQGLGEETQFAFIYYSLVTITTLGYGDITPVTDVAKSFSALEAVVGQIYLVVLVARLVGINIAQSMNKKSR
jgi:hypothetical protein